ncbi:unnamed protein product [Cuscuta campestris]|uniref:Integrase catalytic domain-containing protein n=1 Tax=Cuscuta campestris TaxID=132261 RepID=A0A484N464_9ASTE|nr:unnamed protein product [Cuscuta campestris]
MTSKIGSGERRRTVEDKGAAELWRMYEQLKKRLDAQNPYRQAVFSEVTLLSRRIMSCPLPDNFKTPQIKAYNGTTDPQKNLARFGANVVMYAYPEEIKCRCFLATLERQACEWFHKLPKGSVDKWSDLAHKFLEHFASSRRQKLPFSHLLNVKIRKGEKLQEFINRWEKEARDVQGADDKALPCSKLHSPKGMCARSCDGIHSRPIKRCWPGRNTWRWKRKTMSHQSGRRRKVGHRWQKERKGRITELGLSQSDLKPIHMPLSGFTGDTIEAEGTITVKAGVGDGTHQLWIDMEFMKEEGRPRAEPVEEVEEVPLDPVKPEQKVKVGKTLPPRLKKQLLEVIQAFKVLFAWGLEDMPGVDPKIICHRLAVDPTHKPVKQKKRFLSSDSRDFVTNRPGRIRVLQGVFLGSFQIEFKPRPAIKGQALVDFVVECTAREVEPSGEEPEGNWWTVYTDGSSATDASGGGEFEAKDERMKKYRDTALELPKAFGAYRMEQVPREENAEADILSKLGPDSPEHIKAMTQEEELLEPSISLGQVLVITLKEPDCIDEITMYILDGSLPTDPIAAKVVKRRAPSYTLECYRLYKRSYNGTLLRCLRRDEAQKLMEEIHEGICSAHQGAFTLSRKVTLQGYFSPTIIRGCAEYVRKCKICQEFQKVPGRPARNYTPISTTIPFAWWGIDLVGILPRGTGNNTYLVVAIDYFTKWVEPALVPTITEEQMRKFVSKQILCRFGLPQQIITDNGTQFEARGFNEFLQSWGIKHSYVAVGYPRPMGRSRTLIENEENLRAKLLLIDERRERAYIRAENYRRQVKSYHDQRVRPRQFRMGDWVLRKREVSRPTDGGKFAKSFEGTYVIKEVLANGTFRLQTPVAGDVLRTLDRDPFKKIFSE